jgi:hypothetical protein
MPNWNQIGQEIENGQRAGKLIYDTVRKKYLDQLHQLTGRNVIIYYSGWLQAVSRVPMQALAITDHDVNGFMSACNGVDHTKGLDLLLHTPGGEIAATQAIVTYLHQMFTDVRVIVPQLAMSAGTMIACSAKSIVMGKQSSLGPIDPQIMGLPAHGIIEEFEQAQKDIKQDPSWAMVWQPIIARYPPTLVGECKKAIALSELLVCQWLENGMLANHQDKQQKAKDIVQKLGDHAITLRHERHISVDECEKMELTIERLEKEQNFQDAVLSVHHACMHSLSSTPTLKIIENHLGQAFNVSANLPTP